MRKVHAYIFKPKRSPFYYLRWWKVGERKQAEFSLGVRDEKVANKLLGEFIREKEDEAAGLVAPRALREAAVRPLLDHLGDYVAFLRGRGRDAMYVYNVDSRLKKLFVGCSWVFVRDVTSQSFVLWRTKQSGAAKTLNDYLDAACAFFRWMHPARIDKLPLSRSELRIDGREVVPKRQRRALTDAEFLAVLAGAGAWKAFVLIAVLTGLRRKEISGLLWRDVHLEAAVPFVLARASTTKNGKGEPLPLRDDLVAELRRLRGRAADDDRVFDRLPTMDEWRGLLVEVGIDYKDSQGRQVDVHALRKTRNTQLARAGVSAQLQMKAMRVTDRRLIDQTYMDTSQLALAGLMEAAPRESVTVQVVATVVGGSGRTESPVNSPVGRVQTRPTLSRSAGGVLVADDRNRREKQGGSAVLSGNVQECQNWGTRIRT